MIPNEGAAVHFRFLPEATRYEAIVVSADEENIVLKAGTDALAQLPNNQQIVITLQEGDHFYEYHADVVGTQDTDVMLEWRWEKSRQYFRVEDVFPLSCKNIPEELPIKKSRMFLGYGVEMPEAEGDMPDDTVSPRVWKLLNDINVKLSLVLQKLQMDSEEFDKAEMRQVNISASGMKFSTTEKLNKGDAVEIKMLLPTIPSTGIITYGNIVKVNDSDDGKYEVAIHFTDMEDEIRDEIIQYTLKRQREIISLQRHSRRQRGADA